MSSFWLHLRLNDCRGKPHSSVSCVVSSFFFVLMQSDSDEAPQRLIPVILILSWQRYDYTTHVFLVGINIFITVKSVMTNKPHRAYLKCISMSEFATMWFVKDRTSFSTWLLTQHTFCHLELKPPHHLVSTLETRKENKQQKQSS